MDADTLLRHVKDALEQLYDPIGLQIHPLVSLLDMPRGAGQSTGEALRQLLWDTIAKLRPSSSLPLSRPEWLSYNVLWLHYVQALDRAEVIHSLHLSEASFFRHQRRALEALASLLWEKRCPGAVDEAVQGAQNTQGSDQEAREEAMRLASASEPELVDLGQLIQDMAPTLRLLAEELKVELSVTTDAPRPVVHGDPAVFHQIILDVFTQSADLASASGLELALTAASDETLWQLYGLDPQLARQHEPGLVRFAVSRALVEAYGGQFRGALLDTQPSLSFTIPVARPACAPVVRPACILILDDDLDTVELYRRFLAGQSYLIQVAPDAVYLERHVVESRPDLILLDVLMPRRDGFSVLQRLKTLPETASIPVIVCSVLSQPKLALALGAREVLHKPIQREALLRAVRAVLHEAAGIA